MRYGDNRCDIEPPALTLVAKMFNQIGANNLDTLCKYLVISVRDIRNARLGPPRNKNSVPKHRARINMKPHCQTLSIRPMRDEGLDHRMDMI